MLLGWRPHDLDTAYLPFLAGVGIAVGMSLFWWAWAWAIPFPNSTLSKPTDFLQLRSSDEGYRIVHLHLALVVQALKSNSDWTFEKDFGARPSLS